ncbi:MAG: nickel-dependent hydrogenase large subunit [bacterium]|nr:nickel-dependent hydrogenase large subunit [bacterium]
MKKIKIDPLSRIEGEMAIEVTVDNGVVIDAHVSGKLFRGFELILKDRPPTDAPIFTQRICGVCPASHAYVSALCLDSAFGISEQIPPNARIIRNLILGSNFIQSNVLHFYQFAALDYVDITAVADYKGKNPNLDAVKKFIQRGALSPFFPRYEGGFQLPPDKNIALTGNYIEAFNIRRDAHELLALFGGKMPHQCGIVAGGATVAPTDDIKNDFQKRLTHIRRFINNMYLPDVLTIGEYYPEYLSVGAGCRRLLSYGAFDLQDKNPNQVTGNRFFLQGLTDESLEIETLDVARITEDIKYSWYDGKGDLPPARGETIPNRDKKDAYSFSKSPRYRGKVAEAGPLADLLVNYAAGHQPTRELVDKILSKLGMDISVFFSVTGRNLARMLQTKLVADAMAQWVTELDPDGPLFVPYQIPSEAESFGINSAPRGALGHWLKIENSKIKKYQVITPTSWNASPRDATDTPGPIEQALTGLTVGDEKNPVEIVRAARAFDPCLACAVHVFKPSGAKIGEFRVL